MKLNTQYRKVSDWSSRVKSDGLFDTGHNSGSSKEAAKMLLKSIKDRREKNDIPKLLINRIKGVLFPPYK